MKPLTLHSLRRRVLRPTEGVFLFHSRVMQRLVRRELGRHGAHLALPALSYHLMQRSPFLSALEVENPDALALRDFIRYAVNSLGYRHR